MLNRLRFTVPAALAAVATLLPFDASAGYSNWGAAALGFNVPKGIAAGFTTNTIDMAPQNGPIFTKLAMPMTIVWGTSASFELRLQGSVDGTTWRYVARCTSAEVHLCKPRRWQFDAADWAGINPVLTFVEADYRYLRIELVAGAGTGTLTATGTVSP